MYKQQLIRPAIDVQSWTFLVHREAGLAVENLEEELASLQDEKAQCEHQLLQKTSELNRVNTILTEHKTALETAQNQVNNISAITKGLVGVANFLSFYFYNDD